jgi:SAM-dependent methyltransferase
MIERIKNYTRMELIDNVIDLGGKDGKFTKQISKNLTVVDLDPQEIYENVNYIKTDILQYESDNKFDLVVSSAFMEHFNRDDGIKILNKVNKLLTDNGIAFITCPNAWSVNRLLGEFMGMGSALELSDGDKKVGHKYLYNLQRLEDIIKEILHFIDSGSYFFKPLPANDMISIFDESALKRLALITSTTHPHLKDFLAEIYVVAKKKY